MKKILLLMIASVLIWGCTKKSDPLVFAYQDRIVDALSIIAKGKKFIGEGIETKIFSSGPQTIEALISGGADVASMGDSAALILISKYKDFILLASHGNGPKRHRIIIGNHIKVKDWSDLKDKKIGMKKGTSTHGGFLLKTSALGYDLEGQIIDMSPSVQLTALASGEIDVMVASEPSPSLAEFKGVGTHFASLDCPGMTYPVVLVTTRNVLETKKEKISQLIKGLKMAQAAMEKNKEEVVDIIARINEFPKEMVRKSMSRHHYELNEPEQIKHSMDTLSRILMEMGMISDS